MDDYWSPRATNVSTLSHIPSPKPISMCEWRCLQKRTKSLECRKRHVLNLTEFEEEMREYLFEFLKNDQNSREKSEWLREWEQGTVLCQSGRREWKPEVNHVTLLLVFQKIWSSHTQTERGIFLSPISHLQWRIVLEDRMKARKAVWIDLVRSSPSLVI